MSLKTTLTFGIMATLTSGTDPDTPSDPYNHTWTFDWSSGTGANQADKSYHNEEPILAAETVTYNMSVGAPVDGLGNNFTPARIKMLAIRNTGATSLSIGGANGIVGSGFALRPGEMVMKSAPDATAYAVSGSATITVTNQSMSTAGSFEIAIIGASA